MKRIAAFLLALTACLGLMTVPAAADTGPKPAVTIHVVNAPAEAYYLDLLIPASEAGDYDNLHGKTCDPALLAGLRSWEEEGWVPALSGGTGIPLFGDLLPDEAGSHRFTYYGLPDTFRIAVSGPDGAQATAETFTRTAFYTNLTYDYAGNTVVRATAGWQAVLVQFLATFLPTLAVEGLLLLAFGLARRENLLPVLLTNLVTQIGLHAVIGALGGNWIQLSNVFLHYALLLALPELAVAAVEALVYRKALKGGTTGRRVCYALAANAASFAVGFLPLELMVRILQQL